MRCNNFNLHSAFSTLLSKDKLNHTPEHTINQFLSKAQHQATITFEGFILPTFRSNRFSANGIYSTTC